MNFRISTFCAIMYELESDNYKPTAPSVKYLSRNLGANGKELGVRPTTNLA